MYCIGPHARGGPNTFYTDSPYRQVAMNPVAAQYRNVFPDTPHWDSRLFRRTRIRVSRAFRISRNSIRQAVRIAQYNSGSFLRVWNRAARLVGIRARDQRPVSSEEDDKPLPASGELRGSSSCGNEPAERRARNFFRHFRFYHVNGRTRLEAPEAAGDCSVAVPSEFIRGELNRERVGAA